MSDAEVDHDRVEQAHGYAMLAAKHDAEERERFAAEHPDGIYDDGDEENRMMDRRVRGSPARNDVLYALPELGRDQRGVGCGKAVRDPEALDWEKSARRDILEVRGDDDVPRPSPSTSSAEPCPSPTREAAWAS